MRVFGIGVRPVLPHASAFGRSAKSEELKAIEKVIGRPVDFKKDKVIVLVEPRSRLVGRQHFRQGMQNLQQTAGHSGYLSVQLDTKKTLDQAKPVMISKYAWDSRNRILVRVYASPSTCNSDFEILQKTPKPENYFFGKILDRQLVIAEIRNP